MSSSQYVKAAIAQAFLENAPPSIGESLIERQAFREDYNLSTEAMILLEGADVSFARSMIFASVRDLLGDREEATIGDTNGGNWLLEKESSGVGSVNLVLRSGSRRLYLPDLGVLSPHREVRLRTLEEQALEVNLPEHDRQDWRHILEERALKDEEVDTFINDLKDTPAHVARSIQDQMAAGKSTVSSLVPCSRRYFERFIGVYDRSSSLKDYAEQAGRSALTAWFSWQRTMGLEFSLFLSAHSSLTDLVSVDHLEDQELSTVLQSLHDNGDPLSRLGAVEVGLRVLPDRPAISSLIAQLIQDIRDDDLNHAASQFKLFSALFILVDGELVRARLFSTSPPFYRRLASLSQAALIHRQTLSAGVDSQHFREWAIEMRGESYYMQSLADMRAEPRWNPDLAAAAQLKADHFGRIVIAARRFQHHLAPDPLHDLILGEHPDSLNAVIEFPQAYFPGPLEGSERIPNELPEDLAQYIESKLSSEQIDTSSFVALVNSAMVFRVDEGKAELAANGLRLANHRLANVEDQSQLLAILSGLAIVAAVSRTPALAEELRILSRRYRHDVEYRLPIEEAMKICLTSAASREELMEWREFAGAWLTELAFDDLYDDEAAALHSHLTTLLHIVPELWVSCARADAALRAYIDR